jgi:Mg2+ and Co2+ transporter CorA
MNGRDAHYQEHDMTEGNRYNEVLDELAYILADEFYDAFAPDVDMVEDEGVPILVEHGVVDQLFEKVVARLNQMQKVAEYESYPEDDSDL